LEGSERGIKLGDSPRVFKPRKPGKIFTTEYTEYTEYTEAGKQESRKAGKQESRKAGKILTTETTEVGNHGSGKTRKRFTRGFVSVYSVCSVVWSPSRSTIEKR
jgi:hypothetical protein